MKRIQSFCKVAPVLVILFAGLVHAQEFDLVLEPLVKEAIENNPQLGTLKARMEAFEASVPQAGALPDPMFGFQVSNLPIGEYDFSSTPMTGNQLFLSQAIPFPGTLSAKERAAEHAAQSARAMFEDREGFIVNAVKQAYFRLAFLDQAISITEKNEALLQDFVRIAQTKYSVGNGLQQDVLRAQVALSGLADKLIVLRTQRQTAEARLNLVLNRLPQAPVGTPKPLALTSFELDLEDTQELAVSGRPLLKGIGEQIRMWEASADVARRQSWPNFNFSFGYRQRAFMAFDPVQGSDFLTFGVGLSIPIYRGRKQKQQALAAEARARMASSQLEDAREQVLFDVRALFLEIQKHHDEVDLFESSIIPQAEQALESSVAGYQVDKVDFLAMLDTQVTLFNFEIEYYRHLLEHEIQLAKLEAIVGRRMFAVGD